MPDTGPTRGSWFQRHPAATLVAVVLACCALVDALALRLFLDPKTFSFRRRHPYYHHTLARGFSGSARWGESVYPMFTNSLGLRDRAARTVSLRPAGRRVVFIGDSVTEALGVPHEQSFVGRLEDAAAPAGIEVLNAAVLSYSPKIYYLKTRHLLEREGLRFDELFVLLDVSDVQDEIRYKSFTPRLPTLLDRAWGALAGALYRRSFVCHTLYERVVRPREKRIVTVFDPARWTYWDVAISGLSYSAEDRRRIESVPRDENGRWLWTIDPEVFRAWGEEGLALADRHLAELARLCRENGVRLTIVVYPAPPQIFARDLDSLQVRHWEQFAQANGAGFVNLFPAFIGPEAPDAATVYRTRFIPGDMHFNAEGHRVVAERLAARLLARGAAP